jgi:hypothetical protein
MQLVRRRVFVAIIHCRGPTLGRFSIGIRLVAFPPCTQLKARIGHKSDGHKLRDPTHGLRTSGSVGSGRSKLISQRQSAIGCRGHAMLASNSRKGCFVCCVTTV